MTKDAGKLLGILNANHVAADTFENVITIGIGPDAEFITWGVEDNRWIVITFMEFVKYARTRKDKKNA